MSVNRIFNLYPNVIIGEAIAENDEFAVHTRYPRFLARITLSDEFLSPLSGQIDGEIGIMPENNKLAYNSGTGIWLSDFVFFDSRNKDEKAFAEALKKAGDTVAATIYRIDEEVDNSYDETDGI